MLDFIGIGAQKAGTTWLYDQFRSIQGVNVTPIKELHFFDRSKDYEYTPNFFSKSKLKGRLLEKRWYIRVLKDTFRELLIYKNISNAQWMLKWHFANYSDEFLNDFIKNWNVTGLKGEITPSYSVLEVKDIKRIKDLFPNVKIIFLLRNPIERAWSHCRYRNPSVLNSIDDTIDFINSQEQHLRSNYELTIENYLNLFDKSQILVCFYDCIIDSPDNLLKEILSFINCDFDSLPITLKKVSNQSLKKEIDEKVLNFLKDKYKPMMYNLSENYGSYFTKWVNDYFGSSNKWDKKCSFHP